MNIDGNTYTITSKRPFSPIGHINKYSVIKCFEFAFDMSFGNNGQHRDHRSGGSHNRKKGEIFVNAFQGKLSEFAIFDFLHQDFPEITPPDLKTYGLGEWDDFDFKINGKEISIKSTKFYGNLLLLETKDFDKFGNYLPNMAKTSAQYDIYILVRINPDCEDLMRSKRFLYNNKIDKKELANQILVGSTWEYDIAGFITHEDLLCSINKEYIIPKGSLLNGTVPMDAENYYFESGDMRTINTFKEIF